MPQLTARITCHSGGLNLKRVCGARRDGMEKRTGTPSAGAGKAAWQDQLDRRNRGEAAGLAPRLVKDHRRWLTQLTEDENDQQDERLQALQPTIAARHKELLILTNMIKHATEEIYLSSRIEGILQSNIEMPRIFIILSYEDSARKKPSGLTTEANAHIENDRLQHVLIRHKTNEKAKRNGFPNAWKRYQAYHFGRGKAEVDRLN